MGRTGGLQSKRIVNVVHVVWDTQRKDVIVLRDGISPIFELLSPPQKATVRNAVRAWKNELGRTTEQKEAADSFLRKFPTPTFAATLTE